MPPKPTILLPNPLSLLLLFDGKFDPKVGVGFAPNIGVMLGVDAVDAKELLPKTIFELAAGLAFPKAKTGAFSSFFAAAAPPNENVDDAFCPKTAVEEVEAGFVEVDEKGELVCVVFPKLPKTAGFCGSDVCDLGDSKAKELAGCTLTVDDVFENEELVLVAPNWKPPLVGLFSSFASAGFENPPKLNPPFVFNALFAFSRGVLVTGNENPPTAFCSPVDSDFSSAAFGSILKETFFSEITSFLLPNENIEVFSVSLSVILIFSFGSSSFLLFSWVLNVNEALTVFVWGDLNVNVDAGIVDSVLGVLLTAPNENGGFGLSTSSTFSSFLLLSFFINAVSDFAGCTPKENLTSDGAGSEIDETLLPNEN